MRWYGGSVRQSHKIPLFFPPVRKIAPSVSTNASTHVLYFLIGLRQDERGRSSPRVIRQLAAKRAAGFSPTVPSAPARPGTCAKGVGTRRCEIRGNPTGAPRKNRGDREHGMRLTMRLTNVRFTPESRQIADTLVCPLCAKSRHSHCSRFPYSIT